MLAAGIFTRGLRLKRLFNAACAVMECGLGIRSTLV